MKPQITNYDLFKISHYVLLLGSFIGSISCGSNCNDFGLKNVATNEYDGDWEFYSFGNMDTTDCFLCARWQSDELKIFELLVPCLPEDATRLISLNYFYSPSETLNGNVAYEFLIHEIDYCKSFNAETSTISGGQAMYNSTAEKTGVLKKLQRISPEKSNASIILRLEATYPEDTIFCIEKIDIDVETVPMPTSATVSESSGPKESSPTEITEHRSTSKITQTSNSDQTVPATSEKHSLIGLSSTVNTEELRTVEQRREEDENNNGWTSLWIITVAVVVILLLVLGSVGLLWYRSRRQKGGVARPDKPENNGTDVRGNQLVITIVCKYEMVYNGDPKYYTIEDGEVKTYALPYEEMFNNRDSHETVDKKAAVKSKKTLKTDHLQNSQHTNNSFEQIDKTKGVVENANDKMVDEAPMRDKNEYSKTIFTERKRQLYSVTEASVHKLQNHRAYPCMEILTCYWETRAQVYKDLRIFIASL
ncbi:hypothetical protein BSL78_16753 [Apostichopus japonicus]|uniref:Uncharacterized protein n=1 Tax=Stichopus japonicus TaxID=307972 RepID=A0A2G8KEG9_STIJA|nr:hypothetical protein BSL78_16753 [Apostichopus japonicus]